MTAIVWSELATVLDPEIDISLLDLGVIRSIEIDGQSITIVMAPTRTACPGVHEMKRRVIEAVHRAVPDANVEIKWKIGIWNPSCVSDRGRKVLQSAGYIVAEEGVSRPLTCPYCSSVKVRRDGDFGGSVCKTPFSCRACGSTFDLLGADQCVSCRGPRDILQIASPPR
ncbi:iron-sulfur cluster assembly protein [Amycolatopsis benzoatilytica]|uniref:iron-sulfur cluster assembly protein n=1 Tax=Amycolatopsis benzoatilytica TaxID=346045 RepID=UPI00146BA5F2|nr:iron-sulfur cluster assembly protein [Amycolatopsis benzoatilytica]